MQRTFLNDRSRIVQVNFYLLNEGNVLSGMVKFMGFWIDVILDLPQICCFQNLDFVFHNIPRVFT
ncbi:hypothetical protein Osc7112_0780 [Oscillatoria nigro-viridis PCC 7112]|uniref:Uncharacterized protein n=1 Tax=Phormidium nigroviride PCC 7112 TaxID=179408 RepID=K9VD17_9CYAN|nr:hypothetical protein Osc7112_0780 [Oscillatoria nigro-viridis PCC 7112]